MFNIVLSTFAGTAARLWSSSSLLQLFLFALILLLHVTAPNVSEESFRDEHDSLPPTEETSASLLSRWSFSWVGAVTWKAFKTPLNISDLYALSYNNKSAVVVKQFYSAAPKTFALFWRLYRFAKYDLLQQGAWAMLFSLTSFCPAILLRVILSYVESPETVSRNDAWLCVGGLLVTGIITGISDCQCEWLGRKVSVRLRAILINEIFAKALMRRVTRPSEKKDDGESQAQDSQATDGNILNLMTVDTASTFEASAHIHIVWINLPFQLTIASVILYKILGISGILGVLLMIASLPLNILVAKRQVAAQMKVLSAGDACVQASNELITNICTINPCTWEAEFRKKVRDLREIELSELRGRFFWWSISMTFFYSLPFITTILTLSVYTVVEKQNLETKVVFPALVVFAVLHVPLDRMSAMISFMLQAHVSVGRIEQFLKEKETS
ncbi:uncharacterized protein N7483_007035 [Penicillium malachiteum]|uniref:uncharacterized protein n=1 Tax=Penicillium malachiteum TaxID=1324776 RepID=UPI0025486245|nr:uncharacterized protein N7483_007035 [Penicillium malachiteum]KAJ5725678.1 hypothetical protein N7483_007035 [Penicillium malachiteum]